MHAAPRGIDERSFEVNADYLRGVFPGARALICRTLNVACDALEAFANFIGRRGDGSRDQSGSAVARNHLCDGAERLWRGFHHVARTGAVDVNVHEAGYHGVGARVVFARALGHGYTFAPANRD